jgi:hypothetical protein
MPGETEPIPVEQEHAAQWEIDRAQEATPLPYSHLTHYENEGQRQVDLAAAERNNIARAAGRLGITSIQWLEMRDRLGRSPGPGDVRQ